MDDQQPAQKRRKTRWGEAQSAPALSKDDIAQRADAARQALARAGLIPSVEFPGKGFSSEAAKRQNVMPEMPSNFDAFGRAIDEEGNILPQIRPKYATLKINMNLEKDEKIRQMYKTNKSQLKAYKDPENNPWFDPSLKAGSNKLNKQALRFVEPGFYLRRQEHIERRNNTEKWAGINALQATGSSTSTVDQARMVAENFAKGQEGRRGHGRSQLVLLSANQKEQATAAIEDSHRTEALRRHLVPLQRKRQDAFPDLEWWDLSLAEKLPQAEIASQKLARKWKKSSGWSEEIFPYKILECKITHLVEHPVPIEPIAEKDPAQIPPLMFLTEKEKKKMRRKRRREREQEKQDKIRMGLIPPDPPKVKLSNLMRVLGDEAVAGPTGIEMTVRSQVRGRLEAHEARNAANKLSNEKRAEKTKAKWVQKDEMAVQCAVFSLNDVTDPRLLYKVHQNAKQLHLTGIAIMCPGVGNLVVVEGGPRSIKRYKALMLRRIKWSEEDACRLLWEGQTKTKTFKQWKLISCTSENEVLQHLQEGGATYWAMLRRYRDPKEDLL